MKTLTKPLVSGVIHRFSFTRRVCHETHLSAFRSAPQAHPWVPCSPAYPRRARGDCRTTGQRPSSFERLISLARFRPTQRLRHPEQFASLLRKRSVARTASFDLYRRPSDVDCSRLGLVIGKRQARHAVLRNLIKRQARELFRHGTQEAQACDYVVRLARAMKALPDGAKARKRWVRAQLVELFDKAG